MQAKEIHAKHQPKVEQAIANAREGLAKGFSTEARRKELNERLSRAYSDLRSDVHTLVYWTSQDAGADFEYEKDYPYDLHNVREKHHEYALSVVPELAPSLQLVRDLLAMRNELKAYTLLPKKTPKREQPVRDGDAFQWRGNCQCCMRDHAVLEKTGLMAKHGYTVDHGMFEGVCEGQGFQPLQKDRKRCDWMIAMLRSKAEGCEAKAQDYKDGKSHPGAVVVGYKQVVEFADLPESKRAIHLRKIIEVLERQAGSLRSYADQLAAFADKIHGTELRKVRI